MSSTLAGRLFTTGTAREALVLDFVCKYQIMVKRVLPPLHLQHFSELLDEFSQNVLGQLLNDPFLSEKSVSMEVEPSPTSPAPLIQAEHSYSLCEEPRAQSPFDLILLFLLKTTALSLPPVLILEKNSYLQSYEGIAFGCKEWLPKELCKILVSKKDP